uniref:Uncharacterized protein n=1 Tax=Arundo donax TaxID=35708 RepID=A0A0A9CA77_ARUDO
MLNLNYETSYIDEYETNKNSKLHLMGVHLKKLFNLQ